jgi:hypothetical protein
MLSINEGFTDDDLDATVRAFHRVVPWMRGKGKAISSPGGGGRI